MVVEATLLNRHIHYWLCTVSLLVQGSFSALQENYFTTSIHTLVSACLKLKSNTKIPEERKVFRGLGSMKLGSEWFTPDSRGSRHGVELGFMSTTTERHVALEYSGVKRGKVGIVFEFDVGSVDCGAQLDKLSQYPGFSGQNSYLVKY